MYKDKRIMAVVPARGGSKGVPLKNIRPLVGKPLIAHTAAILPALPEIDRAVVSTDHEDIATAARAAGLHAPFRRPPELSGDRIGDWDVLAHALHTMEQLDRVRYDVILMLQPTCPLRTPEQVRDTLHKLVDGAYDAVWTLSPTDSKAHPLKQYVLSDGQIEHYDSRGATIIARQQLTPVYHRNGAAYAITRECLVAQKSIKGRNCAAVVIETPLANIDTEDDFSYAEYLIWHAAHERLPTTGCNRSFSPRRKQPGDT